MKYTVVCVGKLKERFWKDACAEYTKRLGAYAKVDIREVADIDPAKAGGVDAARDKEGTACAMTCAREPTRCSALDVLPCRITWRAWCCWSKSTAPARSAVASRITNRSAIRNNAVGQ